MISLFFPTHFSVEWFLTSNQRIIYLFEFTDLTWLILTFCIAWNKKSHLDYERNLLVYKRMNRNKMIENLEHDKQTRIKNYDITNISELDRINLECILYLQMRWKEYQRKIKDAKGRCPNRQTEPFNQMVWCEMDVKITLRFQLLSIRVWPFQLWAHISNIAP